jgi:5'-AMP-activated protein kinase catalytic alpha subunit
MGEKLGEGTFGKVKKGTHILTGEKVAIKILEKSRILEKADKIRVEREIKILKMLKHKHIVELYSVIQTSTTIFLIMELSSGKELFDYIVKKKRLDEVEASTFFSQILSSVQYLHSIDVCHRDLKPENLLLNGSDGLKLVDFGLSNLMPNKQLLGTACGSPCYAAPEMLEGNKYEGNGVDVWSCGIILYAMVCGYLPFEDKNNDALYKKIKEGKFAIPSFVSEPCKDLIKRILVTNPGKRIKISDIFKHSWFKITNPSPIEGLIISKFVIPIDEDVIRKMEKYGFNKEEARANILSNKHNQFTTTYYLLLKVKARQGGSSVSDLKSKLFYDYINDPRNLLKHYSNDLSVVIRDRNCSNPKLPVVVDEPDEYKVEEESKLILPKTNKSQKNNLIINTNNSSNSEKLLSPDSKVVKTTENIVKKNKISNGNGNSNGNSKPSKASQGKEAKESKEPKEAKELRENFNEPLLTEVKAKESVTTKQNFYDVVNTEPVLSSTKKDSSKKTTKFVSTAVKSKDPTSSKNSENKPTKPAQSSKNVGSIISSIAISEKQIEPEPEPLIPTKQASSKDQSIVRLDTDESKNEDKNLKTKNEKNKEKSEKKPLKFIEKLKPIISKVVDNIISSEDKNSNTNINNNTNTSTNSNNIESRPKVSITTPSQEDTKKQSKTNNIEKINSKNENKNEYNKKNTISTTQNKPNNLLSNYNNYTSKSYKNSTDSLENSLKDKVVTSNLISKIDTIKEDSDVEFSPERSRATSTRQKAVANKNIKFSLIRNSKNEPIMEQIESHRRKQNKGASGYVDKKDSKESENISNSNNKSLNVNVNLSNNNNSTNINNNKNKSKKLSGASEASSVREVYENNSKLVKASTNRKNKFSSISSVRNTMNNSNCSTPSKHSKYSKQKLNKTYNENNDSLVKSAKKDNFNSYNFNNHNNPSSFAAENKIFAYSNVPYDPLYTDFNKKVIKEKVIKYTLQPSTNRELTVNKPSKTFNKLIKLTTNEYKAKQIGEFGVFKNYKNENFAHDMNCSQGNKHFKSLKNGIRSPTSMTYSNNYYDSQNTKLLHSTFRPRDLNCLFNEDKNLFVQMIKISLNKLLISTVYRVR